MCRTRFFSLLMIIVYGLPPAVIAGDYDGSQNLWGSVTRIVEVTRFGIRDDVDPDVVGLPQFFIQRTVKPGLFRAGI